MDVLRAMDYLLSRPEVAPEKGVVWGASQGRGFSLVVAALRPQSRYCIADVPFLCVATLLSVDPMGRNRPVVGRETGDP
ncbi:hypothetical protein CMK14_09435 [Candidatus Poribacteria bacterium]|nr:hypothetical protein [Candidatus Poribacteria bacterium]